MSTSRLAARPGPAVGSSSIPTGQSDRPDPAGRKDRRLFGRTWVRSVGPRTVRNVSHPSRPDWLASPWRLDWPDQLWLQPDGRSRPTGRLDLQPLHSQGFGLLKVVEDQYLWPDQTQDPAQIWSKMRCFGTCQSLCLRSQMSRFGPRSHLQMAWIWPEKQVILARFEVWSRVLADIKRGLRIETDMLYLRFYML